MPDTLLATKFYIPPPLTNLVSRERLLNRLDEGIRHEKRLTLISAPQEGLSNSFISLGRIAGTLWAGFVFDLNLIYPYISGAITMLIGFIFSLVWLKGDKPACVLGKNADHSTPG